MALIVEDGTGRADAESYISVTDADTFHSNRGNSAWAAISTTPAKEALLRQATDYMEQAYRERWLSFRVTPTQALSWPRAWMPMPDAPQGYGSWAAFIPNNVVPNEVKYSCATLALIANSGELAPALAPAALRETVGPITVEYDPESPNYTQYRAVDMWLKVYLGASRTNAKLIRT